jgi:hypothetical protein
MRAWPSLICTLAMLAGPAQARVTGRMIAWGEMDAADIGPMSPDAHEHALTRGRTIADPVITRQTDRITARLCQQFGATASFTAGPGEDLPDRVQVHSRHPMLTRPEDGATSTDDSFETSVAGGQATVGFTFDHGWELQPGTWTMEFTVDGEVVAAQSFTITLPPAGTAQTVCVAGPTS